MPKPKQSQSPTAPVEPAPAKQEAHVPETPLTEANKKATARGQGKAAKAKPEAPAKPKAKKYGEEVTAVARYTREALPPGARAPGAKQVQAVVAAVGDRAIPDAAGLPMAKVRAWALKGERPEDYASLRALAKDVNDPWAVSKRLCVILVGLDDFRKAASR